MAGSRRKRSTTVWGRRSTSTAKMATMLTVWTRLCACTIARQGGLDGRIHRLCANVSGFMGGARYLSGLQNPIKLEIIFVYTYSFDHSIERFPIIICSELIYCIYKNINT